MTAAALAGILAAACGASLLLALVLTSLARRIALRIGFVDRPGGHKSHAEPKPYGGGVAIFFAAWIPLVSAVLAAYLLGPGWFAERFGELAGAYVGGIRLRIDSFVVLLVGGAVLHVLGLMDDRNPQSAHFKLMVILVVALATASLGGIRLAEFADAPLSVALTTLWIVVVVNAFNFLDNMDGLSAGVACICLAFFVACGLLAGQVLVPALGCVFLGAVAGFLVFNFPPAKIFMGDAGSLLIGFMLALLSVQTTYYDSGGAGSGYALAMPLIILAIPLYDFVSVVVIRLLEGRNPLRGDQRHFSHRLVDRGLSRRFAVLTIYLATATTGLSATLLPDADLRITLTVVAIVTMVLAIVAILEAPLRKSSS